MGPLGGGWKGAGGGGGWRSNLKEMVVGGDLLGGGVCEVKGHVVSGLPVFPFP